MEGIIPWFGALIQNLCPRNPELARRLLRLGYHAKNLQLKAAPGKLNRAAQQVAIETTTSIVRPLDHPDRAAHGQPVHPLRDAAGAGPVSLLL